MLNDKINCFNNNLQHLNYKKITYKDALNKTYSLIEKQWAPVAQLDRALCYGTIGSASRTFRDRDQIPTLLA